MITDRFGRDSMGKDWESMGTGTKLTVLKQGIGELMRMNILIMKKLGIEIKGEEQEKGGMT